MKIKKRSMWQRHNEIHRDHSLSLVNPQDTSNTQLSVPFFLFQQHFTFSKYINRFTVSLWAILSLLETSVRSLTASLHVLLDRGQQKSAQSLPSILVSVALLIEHSCSDLTYSVLLSSRCREIFALALPSQYFHWFVQAQSSIVLLCSHDCPWPR